MWRRGAAAPARSCRKGRRIVATALFAAGVMALGAVSRLEGDQARIHAAPETQDAAPTAQGDGGAASSEGTAAQQPPPGAPAHAPIDAAAVPNEAVSAVAEQLNCPTCQGYSLRDCPLTVCAQMREQIRISLAEGQDEQTIIDGFVAYYGPQVLNAPPREGFFLLAWWLPPLVLLTGAVGLVAWGWRQHRVRRLAGAPRRAVRASLGEPDGSDPDVDGYQAAFERLARRDEES